MGEVMSSILLHVGFFSVNTQKDVVGITRHVVTTISAFSFTMLLLDRILTHIVNHLSNTSYHFQYLYYPGGNETGAKPNLITCITEIFLSAANVAGNGPQKPTGLVQKLKVYRFNAGGYSHTGNTTDLNIGRD
jgi:hypothetical protein